MANFDLNIESIKNKPDDDENKPSNPDDEMKWQILLLREKFAKWVKFLISIWLCIILSIVVFHKNLCLSDSVLIALLSTTTINILGLCAIILRGLFK